MVKFELAAKSDNGDDGSTISCCIYIGLGFAGELTPRTCEEGCRGLLGDEVVAAEGTFVFSVGVCGRAGVVWWREEGEESDTRRFNQLTAFIGGLLVSRARCGHLKERRLCFRLSASLPAVLTPLPDENYNNVANHIATFLRSKTIQNQINHCKDHVADRYCNFE